MSNLFDDFESVQDAGYDANKDVVINRVDSIHITNFRSLHDRTIKLGKYITIIVGRNATMKTSLLGLIAHPFGSSAKDCFGFPLKTDLSNVFKLSDKYDRNYEYTINLIDNQNNKICSPVSIYKRPAGNGFRVVVGKSHKKGEGNFNYNTSYMSFSRMNPIVETNAVTDSNVVLSENELRDLKQFYERILPSKHYNSFEGVKDKKIKETFGPAGVDTQYDFNSISSGEDVLGAIFNKIIAFRRALSNQDNAGNGVFCIDELEAGLHPSAQFALFKYLIEWAQVNKVQIVFSTHSIYLIERIYREYKESMNRDDIGINFVSCAEAHDDKNYPILYNPKYAKAYKELTLESPEDVVESHKIKVLCEDKRAESFIKYLLGDDSIISKLDIITDRVENRPGTPYTALKQVLKVICSTFPILLPDAFVVFDADVPEFSNCDTTKYIILPDADRYPIEKRIAVYICELDNSDPFFRFFNKEQTLFLSQMSERKIPLSITEMRANTEVAPFKNWANSDPNFDQYLKKYIESIPNMRNQFRKEVLKRMNDIYVSMGLPEISEPKSWNVSD